jgi:translation initiation factor IF-2
MSRKRIHELAKEWGVETRQVLTQLEAQGTHGKKAQSTLSEQEVDAVQQALRSPTPPALVLGEEKVVAERVVTELDQQKEHVVTAREEIRENRIRPNLIRRRRRVEVLNDDTATWSEEVLNDDTATWSESAPVAFSAPTVEEPLPTFAPVAFYAPVQPPAPFIPEPLSVETPAFELPSESRDEPPQQESRGEISERSIPVSVEDGTAGAEEGPTSAEQERLSTVIPSSDTPAEEPQPVVVAEAPPPGATSADSARASENARQEGARPARVLGRIDLGKFADPPVPRPAGFTRPASHLPLTADVGTREGTGGEGIGASGKKRGKKRKVIRNAESLDVQERETHVARGAKKKRFLPGKEQRQTEITVPKASKRVVRISEVVTVGDFAHSLGVKVGEVIKKLMGLGVMATINQVLDHDTASLVAADFEYTVENVAFDVESVLEDEHEASEDEGALEPRPPVVTIMGHVDHGKTSLLDKIRQTNVTDHEQGGITQHIGAYNVPVEGRSVTFLDTPGHEAFTSMRARGAKATDIVTLVVAADDGVMPQTVEAINHARAADVPMIVAVNKIDKPGADPERVKRELMSHGLVAEDLGGETIFAPVSALTGEGVAHLLEMLILQTDIMELRANPDKFARGVIVEAQLDRGRGAVATVLIQEGQLKVGDPFVCGTEHGRVRAMVDSRGQKVKIASPAMPVEILGLAGVPEAGDTFVALGDEAKARQIAEHRTEKRRETELTKSSRTSLEDFYQQAQAGEVQELRVIIKADVQGSAEAVRDALTRLSTDEVKLTVLHASVGGISESDVLLASASKGVIIGFNIRPEVKAAQLADREGIELRLYGIIYDVIADVRAAMEGLLAPTYKENPLGRAEVREVFAVSKTGLVAGCMVVEGGVTRGAQVRVVRDHVVVHTGRLSTLRRFKDDVREVSAGTECGASVENFQDVKVGDVLEVYELEEVVRRLEPRSQEVEHHAS